VCQEYVIKTRSPVLLVRRGCHNQSITIAGGTRVHYNVFDGVFMTSTHRKQQLRVRPVSAADFRAYAFQIRPMSVMSVINWPATVGES
jgi:hypothetical protein